MDGINLKNIKYGDIVHFRNGGQCMVDTVKESPAGSVDLKFSGSGNSVDWHGFSTGFWGTKDTVCYQDIVRVELSRWNDRWFK